MGITIRIPYGDDGAILLNNLNLSFGIAFQPCLTCSYESASLVSQGLSFEN